ncbi:hypothetical protein PENSPDRAFT_740128 [Peniophora sp. CONT]|nr:hypothetical protein PENSPDRAFT_740128 [Peniophora sp. CONT]
MYTPAFLPADILCRVFLLVQALDPILHPGPNWNPDLPVHVPKDEQAATLRASKIDAVDLSTERRLAWLNLSHVCSHWRSVAIEQRSLWTSPTLYLGLNWFNTMLSRSDGALLSLSGRECGFQVPHMPTRSHAVKMVSNLAREQPERMRSLKFGGMSELVFLQMPFSALESYQHDISPAIEWNRVADLIIPPGTPLNLFGGQALQLRSLHLRTRSVQYHQLPKASPLWNCLEHLHLSLSGDLQPVIPIIRRSSNLRSLFLRAQCDNEPFLHEESSMVCGACLKAGFKHIAIPSLLSIELHGCIQMLAHLLNHLHCDPAARVQIHSESFEATEMIALPQLRRVLDFDNIRAPSARAIALIGDDSIQLCMSSSSNAVLCYHPRTATDDVTRNDADVEFCLTLHSIPIRVLLPLLSETKIMTIARPANRSSNVRAPRYHFARSDFLSFTSLCHLTITGGELNAILPLLSIKKGDDPSTITLPSLTTLSIGGNTVWTLISPGMPNMDATYTIVAWLRAILSSRKETGKRPVAQLYVHIREELANIQAEKWELTSCSKYLQDVGKVVRERLGPLRSIPGCMVLPYDAVVGLGADIQTSVENDPGNAIVRRRSVISESKDIPEEHRKPDQDVLVQMVGYGSVRLRAWRGRSCWYHAFGAGGSGASKRHRRRGGIAS